MSLYDEVYGLKYESAANQTRVLVEGMSQQMGIGFGDIQSLTKYAHDYHLDKVVFSNMSHAFMCVSHKGEILAPTAFTNYYGNLLFIEEKDKNGRIDIYKWYPNGFEYFDNAYIVGEQSDGIHKPLYYRDYTVPTGYYSEERDAFNVAKPFPVFAAETGADTSHIYKYIEHLAGECAYHLLAWLRAKLLYPTVKTQVVPIIVSRTQGSGKTTFAEVICKGLFGKDNVLVTDQYDSSARFNADYADALIVCHEEKEETDRRNPASTIKSRSTATTIRKEHKGLDPIYQDSYTDFIMTTNKDVPIKFDGREDQRRFMVMETDPDFTRKTSELADEVFTKLYGYDANYNKIGKPFVEDKELIAQFKHELFSREDIKNVELRNFPKTPAYYRCYTLPRTSESTEIESIMRSLAPFIKATLLEKQLVVQLDDNSQLNDIIHTIGAIQYMPAYKNIGAYVALCRPLVFYEMGTMKPYAHSTVERSIYDCGPWLLHDFGIAVMPDMDALPGGFTGVAGRYRTAAAAKFCLSEDFTIPTGKIDMPVVTTRQPVIRTGNRFRVDEKFRPDDNGCFETVNELKPTARDLTGNKTEKVQYMDTFLLESDTPTKIQEKIERQRAEEHADMFGENSEIDAEKLYAERLEHALSVSQKLFDDGIVARIVYSGAKSYHLLIRVADAPKNLDEYRWLHAYLSTSLTDKLVFDASTCDPARLTRSPITMKRVTIAYGVLACGKQRLIAENWNNLYRADWRSVYEVWLNRPKKAYEKRGHALYPTQEEYREALEAIIDGSFWSDEKYNGERQRLFFPAYRLLRVLGYSADEAWDNIILPRLSTYYKQGEVHYWKSRRNAALITKIDGEIDEYNAEWENKDA